MLNGTSLAHLHAGDTVALPRRVVPGSARLLGTALALALCAAGATLALLGPTEAGAPHSAAGSPASELEVAYGKLPMRFEENRGQTASQVEFLSRGPGYSLFLTPREAVLSLTKATAGAKGSEEATTAVVRMGLVGANSNPEVGGVARLPGVSNYLKGRDPSQWQTGVPGFSRVAYRAVYPGIDMVYHGKRGQLEYDFLVAPRRDPGRIGIQFKGSRGLAIDPAGDLLVRTTAATLRQKAPVSYQTIAGVRRPVASRYVLKRGNRVGFRLGAYDRSRRLVIDPELVYVSYLGGPSIGWADGVEGDAAGNSYVLSNASNVNFPTTSGAFQQTLPGGGADMAVTKLNPSGTALVYSTYLGGSSGSELARDIAIDATGRAYVTGSTTSADYPTTANAFATTGGQTFVTVLNAQGSGLDYSTILSGTASGQNTGGGVAVDSTGKAYITGFSSDDTLPVRAPAPAAPLQSTRTGGQDAFIAKLDPAAAPGDSSLVYSTYLGGAGDDRGVRVAVDPSNNAYVVGSTASDDFPTQNAFQATRAGGNDAFIAKIGPQGSTLVYSTYLGGPGDDTGGNTFPTPGGASFRGAPQAIALDSSSRAYITGTTTAAGFPTKSAFQATLAGQSDGYVAKLDPAASGASSLAYSSYIGGGNLDVVRGAGVDPAGGLFLAGYTRSIDFPVVDPFAPAGAILPGLGRSTSVVGDAFVAYIKPDGGLSSSSYLGGGLVEGAHDLSTDPSGTAYIAGATTSPDLGTPGVFQEISPTQSARVQYTGFVAKIRPGDPAAPLVTGLSTRTAPSEGGTSIVLSGRGFSGAGAVRFGTVPASSFTVDSDSQITAVTPPHELGPAGVTVTSGGKTSPAGNPIATVFHGHGYFGPAGSLLSGRTRAAAVLLKNGKVLVAGGVNPSGTPKESAELFDPVTGTWSGTGSLNMARCLPLITLLDSGKVLIAGGGTGCAVGNSIDAVDSPTMTAETYDPATGEWTTIKPMTADHLGGSATLLRNGKVLVAGGGAANTAELYDPQDGSWTATGPLTTGRTRHGATLLSGAACAGSAPPSYCGKVLVAGGKGSASAEIYDPASGTWTDTQPLAQARGRLTAVSLADGSVLVAGGCRPCGDNVDDNGSSAVAEVYNPATGTWSPVASLRARRESYAATLLPNGKVLFVGGTSASSALRSAEVFDPATGQFTPSTMANYREYPFAVALSASTGCGANCGGVIVGGDVSQAGKTTELYAPAAPLSNPGPGPGPGPGTGPRPTPTPGPGGGGQAAAFAGCPTLTANVVRGSAAGETIEGTPRADRIFAGAGNDTVDGRAGNDCVDLGPGADRGRGSAGDDLVVGGLGADRLLGGAAADRLLGGGGNDDLRGESGPDRINGEGGRDTLQGGGAGDVMSGGAGDDRIGGGAGSDRISAGSGNDRIDVRDGRRDRVDCGRGRDQVVADRIDVIARNCERIGRPSARGSSAAGDPAFSHIPWLSPG